MGSTFSKAISIVGSRVLTDITGTGTTKFILYMMDPTTDLNRYANVLPIGYVADGSVNISTQTYLIEYWDHINSTWRAHSANWVAASQSVTNVSSHPERYANSAARDNHLLSGRVLSEMSVGTVGTGTHNFTPTRLYAGERLAVTISHAVLTGTKATLITAVNKFQPDA